MQAQPRGKKRDPQENIDAGGKKSKKEEGEEEPKPYVCAIYRRDIASFLPRAKIQQWRQTSSHSNASLIEFPSLLPRFKYHWLMVIFASSDHCRVKKDGFLNHQSLDNWMRGTEFNSIFKFRLCCSDVKDSTSELVGQRLFPNKPDDEGVAFRLCVDLSTKKRVVCRVPNLLTKKTAPAMLHFLHHLSQACFECIDIFSGVTVDAAECVFNPLVLQALPKFRLRGVWFGPVMSWMSERLNGPRVMVASEMRIHFNRLYYRSFNFGAGLPHLLDFIAHGRQLDKGLVFGGAIRCQDIDQIIKHFVEDVLSLEGVIRDVRCDKAANEWSGDWPARCPREAATQVTERDDGTGKHRFDYTNAHSGEPFSLLLGTRRHEGLTQITKFHLKFGST